MADTVCFLSGTRYRRPLEAVARQKFAALSFLGEIAVIAFSRDGRPHRFTEHASFYLLPSPSPPLARYLLMGVVGPPLLLLLVVRGVRVVVAQSPYEGAVAAIVKVIAGVFGTRVAVVVESHGDFEQSLFLQRRVALPSVYVPVMRRLAAFGLRHADVFRAVSDAAREQLAAWAPGTPIVRFPAWTDLDVFLDAGSADVFPDAGAAPARRAGQGVLFAGALIPRKGVHILLDAFALVARDVPETLLEIAGAAENPDYARDLQRQAERLGLAGRVRFLGPLPQDQLAGRMAAAEVFVLPSLSEGLPRVVYEAMACGRPVVGSRAGGIPELIEDGVTGFLVPPGDAASLADRIRWVITHPTEGAQMGQRGRAAAQALFSPEFFVREYGALFALARDARSATARAGGDHGES